MKTQPTCRLIEDETPILPEIVAETVVAEYYAKNKIEVRNEQENQQYVDLIDCLSKKANELYNVNAFFKKKIKASGNKGRDNLFMFMEHWIEGRNKNISSN